MKEKWKFMNVSSTYFEYTPHFTRLAGLTNFIAEKLLSKRSVIFGRSFIGVDTDRFEKLWNILISTVLGPYVHVPDILSQTSWYKSLYCCDRCCLRHKTSIDNCQPRTQSYWSFHTLKTWSGRVFSGSWIWTKYGAWFRKNTKYLGGKRDLIATQEAGFTKI